MEFKEVSNMYLYNQLTNSKNTQKKLYEILRRLGVDFKRYITDKEERIKFQKLVYALQKNGFVFGYNYNMYLNGPYSSTLADDGYYIARNLEKFENDREKFSLSTLALEKIKKTEKYLNKRTNDVAWLETITTLDYLYNESYFQAPPKEQIFHAFKQLKPYLYNKNRLESAWKIISEVLVHDRRNCI